MIDFASAVDVQETDSGKAISTTKIDFASAEDVPPPVEERVSAISQATRAVLKDSPMTKPLEMFKASIYLAEHLPDVEPGEDFNSYAGKINSVFESRESEIIKGGIGQVIETPMQALLAGGLITAPVQTIIGVGAFGLKDKFINLRRIVEDKFPNTSPEVKDIAELADFAIFGALIGKGMHMGKAHLKSVTDALGMPRNVNVSSDVVGRIKNSVNMTPTEKIDAFRTLGMEDKHIHASLSGDTPINIPVSKVMELAEKPYWELAKHEIMGGTEKEMGLFGKPIGPKPDVAKPKLPAKMKVDDVVDKPDILTEFPGKKLDPNLVPTVNVKSGNPVITKIVNKIADKMGKAEEIITERNKTLDNLVTSAEKSREPLLSMGDKIRRKAIPANREIFQALSGEKVELTKQEQAVVDYTRSFFKEAKETLALDNARKNYVTHLEQSFMEKVIDKGIFESVRDVFKDRKSNDIPLDIMLELDNILGSEKFFRFALERKGGIEPTTDLRRIVNTYSHLYETKKVIDEVLPEGTEIVHKLLAPKAAVWMQEYLQNLSGRGLDYSFRTGPMGWLSKVADGIVDLGYLKLLGLPGGWKSSIKNIVAGEANTWIYQDFPTYLKGKQRFISNPKKAYKLASEYGALEGTYSDFAQKGIGNLKKAQDALMIHQKVGEIEIRSSIFASMLSDAEWKSGVLKEGTYASIKDTIAKTQGIFSKWDSPLLAQTWYGRMFLQMNRWRITNAAMLTGIVKDSYADIKDGNYKSQNVSRLGKALLAYGSGMYISYQLGLAGYKTASDTARSMATTIDGTMSLFTKGELTKMFTENPTFQTLKELSNTIQNTANYLHIPGAEKAKGREIKDTYVAPIEGTKDLLETVTE